MPLYSVRVDKYLLHTNAHTIVADWHLFPRYKGEEELEANA